VSGVAPTRAAGDDEVVTWHHGLIARWWANFKLDGPEIAYFREFVEAGQPALDAACGTGRLLVPWVADGLDVDGVDASAHMIARCQEAAARVGRSPSLYVQALHRLDLPRRYGAIIVCGGFGLGATREQDVEGLRRLLAHLEPSGVLALDYEVETFDADRWSRWKSAARDPSSPPPEERRLAPDGFAYALRHRIVAVDVTTRQMTRELQAWQWSGDELVAYETNSLNINVYSSSEILDMLQDAGFADIRTVGGYHGGPPTGSEQFLVYLAHRPAAAR
jgi:SAM-dependent methyltransferase